MEIIRQIVNRDSITAVSVPEEFGEQVEIIVLPVAKKPEISPASRVMHELQEKNGFAVHILGDAAEDIWNEL